MKAFKVPVHNIALQTFTVEVIHSISSCFLGGFWLDFLILLLLLFANELICVLELIILIIFKITIGFEDGPEVCLVIITSFLASCQICTIRVQINLLITLNMLQNLRTHIGLFWSLYLNQIFCIVTVFSCNSLVLFDTSRLPRRGWLFGI